MSEKKLNIRNTGMIALFFLILIIVWQCADEDPWTVTDMEIVIQPDKLIPHSVDVIEGAKVIWTNEDTTAHTVISGSPQDRSVLFNIGPIQPKESGSHRFDSTGSFLYFTITAGDTIYGIINVEPDTVEVVERL